jgi:tetratricopeptide (TPR) repeat protein
MFRKRTLIWIALVVVLAGASLTAYLYPSWKAQRLFNAANHYYELNQWRTAARLYSMVLEIEPENTTALRHMISIAEVQPGYNADDWWKRLTDTAPSRWDYHLGRVNSLIKAERYRQARSVMEKRLPIDPTRTGIPFYTRQDRTRPQ